MEATSFLSVSLIFIAVWGSVRENFSRPALTTAFYHTGSKGKSATGTQKVMKNLMGVPADLSASSFWSVYLALIG